MPDSVNWNSFGAQMAHQIQQERSFPRARGVVFIDVQLGIGSHFMCHAKSRIDVCGSSDLEPLRTTKAVGLVSIDHFIDNIPAIHVISEMRIDLAYVFLLSLKKYSSI